MGIRVVSLVPSATETLSSWGVVPIACTRFCERADLVHVGGTKDPDIEAIYRLEPDLVVVDTEENRLPDAEAMEKMGLEVLALSVRDLPTLDISLLSLAKRVGVDWSMPTLGPATKPALTAFIPIWRRPWMALGQPTYGASILAHLGVQTVYQNEGPYPKVDLSEVRSRGCDVVLAPSEPYPFTKRQLPELQAIAPTVLIDGKDLFWWGVRTQGAILRLGAVIRGLC